MTCWASTSSAPGRKILADRARPRRPRPAPRAPRDIRSGCRARGSPRLGSSSRWLARPIRCSRRERALGRAHLDDAGRRRPSRRRDRGWRWQTSARSSPARHRAFDLAPRLLATASRGGCRSAELSSLTVPQVLEDELGEAARVGEDQRGAGGARSPRITCATAQRAAWPPQGMRSSSGSRIDDLGLGARLALDQRRPSRCRRHGASQPRIGLGIGDGGRQRRPAAGPARSPAAAPAQREQVAALAGGEGVDLVDHHAS